jgi:crotonobetainyl-CoA:carnitine CoA-transferase CaiB-like acyl-CoA transferase
MSAPGPLDGIRVLTLTQAWSGTFATELLGLLGADVIQIEARRRPDTWRGGYERPIPSGIKDPNRRQRGWNLSPLYNAVNLNKRAITLDMGDPEGMEYFKRLVPLADVVVDNFSPRVMGNWGLGFEALTDLKPGIVQASLSAYGASGPYRDVPGIGGTIEPMSGMSSLMGYEGGPPSNSGSMYPDPVAGMYMASAILTALHHKDETGIGQYIDLGMMEANATFVGDAFAEFSANGTVRPRLGNHHLRIAPHNIYEARDGGWLALSADDEVQWAALKVVLGLPELDASDFATMELRKANEARLDELVGGWVAQQEASAAEAMLIEARIPAARVRGAAEVLDHPQLIARGFPVEVTHPEAGTQRVVGVPWRFSRTPAAVTRPAPMLGEHSREVLREFLDVDDATYESLVARNVSGDEPPV